MRFVVVDEKGIRVEECPDNTQLEAMQKAVGGLIETIFTVKNPNSENTKHMLTGYANEEGLYLFDAPNHFRVRHERGRARGPMVIAGLDYENGGALSLTEDDIEYIHSRVAMAAIINF